MIIFGLCLIVLTGTARCTRVGQALEMGNAAKKWNEVNRKAEEAETKGNYEEALSYYRERFELNKSGALVRRNTPAGERAYNVFVYTDCQKLSAISLKLGRYEEALQYSREGLEYCEKANTRGCRTGVYEQMSAIYTAMGRPEDAAKYAQQASGANTASANSTSGEFDKAMAEGLKNASKETMDVVNKAREGVRRMNEIHAQAQPFEDRAKEQASMGFYEPAIAAYEAALKFLNASRKGLSGNLWCCCHG
jgi:tetratricopeptide (TPR) repeat protein